jgi:prepilin-type N-terminal cleavage/methylation domain-containing protein
MSEQEGRSDSRGFTLVEVVIVLVLLAIAAGVAVPALLEMTRESRGSRRTADEIGTLLQRTRRTALDRGTAVTLTLSPVDGRYWVSTSEWPDDQPVAAGALELDPGVRVLSAAPRVRFRFDAAGRGAGDPVLVEDAGPGVIVGLAPWTGEPFVRTR